MPPKPISFTAIDFETAQGPRWSVCQVGIVQVKNFEIVEKVEFFIKPPDNYYSPFNIRIHGINPSMTLNAPTFKNLWPKIQKYIVGQLLVAHNAPFDKSCLIQSLQFYKLAVPKMDFHCTYELYGEKLNVLCEKHNIELSHHNALSDALACAQLFAKYHAKTYLR